MKLQIYALIALLVFGSIVLSCFLFFGGSFSDSILPELLGFSLEGIFLVLIFSWHKERLENRRIINKKKGLKKSLKSQLGIVFQWAHPDGLLDGLFTDWKKVESTDLLIKEFKEKKLCDVKAIFIRNHAESLSNEFMSMYPIAASIDHSHFEIWSLINKCVICLSETQDEDKTHENLVNLLEAVREFESLTVSP